MPTRRFAVRGRGRVARCLTRSSIDHVSTLFCSANEMNKSAPAIKMYGIKNCDTVKKARSWLDLHGIAYDFVDFKKSPPNADQVALWRNTLGVNSVLNRRGATWKKLTASEQSSADSTQGAIAIMVTHPSAIKRPIIETGSDFLIGFDEAAYQSQFL